MRSTTVLSFRTAIPAIRRVCIPAPAHRKLPSSEALSRKHRESTQIGQAPIGVVRPTAAARR
jgi:hypothetical protein